jgi:hypothetical protein
VSRSTSARTLLVCRHEAAHAVLSHEMGFHVLKVVVAKWGGAAPFEARVKTPDPLRLGMAFMAGHAADVLWSRQAERRIPHRDHVNIRRLGFRGYSLPTLFALAAGQCQVHEKAIRRVAAALRKGDLDRRAFLRALREPPTQADLAAAKHGRAWKRQLAARALQLAAERAELRRQKRGGQ